MVGVHVTILVKKGTAYIDNFMAYLQISPPLYQAVKISNDIIAGNGREYFMTAQLSKLDRRSGLRRHASFQLIVVTEGL